MVLSHLLGWLVVNASCSHELAHYGVQRFFKSTSFANQSGISFAACGYKSLYEFLMVTSATPATPDISVTTNNKVN
jgi:hypothetical protein